MIEGRESKSQVFFHYLIINKVLQVRLSSPQNAELKCLDELDKKTEREDAHCISIDERYLLLVIEFEKKNDTHKNFQ